MKPVLVWVALCFAAVGVPSCGDSGESCPGKICSNCAQSDCDYECPSSQEGVCVGLEFFGQDNPQELRCAFCQ